MKKYRIIQIKNKYYVQNSRLGLIWMKLGKPALDGGYAGPEEFNNLKDAETWMDKLIKTEIELKKKSPKIIHKTTQI